MRSMAKLKRKRPRRDRKTKMLSENDWGEDGVNDGKFSTTHADKREGGETKKWS